MNTIVDTRWSRWARLGFAALAALTLSSPAFLSAQASDAQEEEDVETLQEFVSTGSLIPQGETAFDAKSLPITLVTRTTIEKSGFQTTSELLQKTTISNGGAVPISNNATGFTPAASSVSLRGLGPDATLVLINGKRVASYPIGTGGTASFVDINSIPLNAISRVEILKDGASATYGADAVAGVVNIILRHDYEGMEVTGQYGNTIEKDSSETIVNAIWGTGGKDFSITVGANYYNREAIFNGDRDYSFYPPFLSTNSSPLNFNVSRAAIEQALGLPAGGNIPGVGTGGTSLYAVAVVPDSSGNYFWGNGYMPNESNTGNLPASAYTYSTGRLSLFNFNEFSGALPERRNMGAFATFDKALDHLQNWSVYGDLMFQHSQYVNELAASATGNFANPGGFSIVVPARTATPIGARLTTDPGAYNPFNPFNQDISGGSRARLAEFGNRIYRDETNAYQFTFGLQGKDLFGSNWSSDLGYRYSKVSITSRNTLVSISKFNRLMNANDSFFDPTSGDYLGTTMPYNPFGYFRNEIANNLLVTPAALVELHDTNNTELSLLYLNLATPSLFSLPAGDAAFGIGTDYRRESILQSPDIAGLSGDVIGSSTANKTNTAQKIWSAYAQLDLPITSDKQDIPGFHELTASLSARYESFSNPDDSVTVPKISLKYQPVEEPIVVRFSWGQGLRNPSLFERFAEGLNYSLTPVSNPYLTPSDPAYFEPEQDVTQSSNPLLAAEETESYNLGAVWTPSALNDKFSFSIDFWKIKRDGEVTLDFQDVVNRVRVAYPNIAQVLAISDLTVDADNASTLIPGEYVRFLPSGNIELVGAVYRNLGSTDIQGVDVSASYLWETDFGAFEFGGAISYLDQYEITQYDGAPTFDYVGQDVEVGYNLLFNPSQPATSDAANGPFGGANPIYSSPGSANDGYLQYKAEIYVDWSLGAASARLTGHYTDGFQDFQYDDNGNVDPFEVESQWLFDFQGSYNFFGDSESWFSDSRVTVGVRNLFDQDPPFSSGLQNNSTAYPGFIYTPENAFWYLSLNKKL